MNKHLKMVKELKDLRDYCDSTNCRNCVFACLGNCPFYYFEDEVFDQLKKEAKRLGGENGEKTRH